MYVDVYRNFLEIFQDIIEQQKTKIGIKAEQRVKVFQLELSQ
jgi:hypothetical protein